LREANLHWLDEGISQSKENRGAKDDGDEDLAKGVRVLGGFIHFHF